MTFSAQLNGLSLDFDTYKVEAQKVQLWVSPVSLALGRLHMSDLEVGGAQVRSSIPLLPAADEEKSAEEEDRFQGTFPKAYPNWVGQKLRDFDEFLDASNLGIEEVELSSISLQSPDLSIESLSLELENLGLGQARVQWGMQNIAVVDRLAPIDYFSGTVSLLIEQKNLYQVYFGQVEVGLFPDSKNPNVDIRGAWPGQVLIDVNGDWGRFQEFFSKSSWLSQAVFAGKNEGSLALRNSVRLRADSIDWVQSNIETQRFWLDNFYLNELSLQSRVEFGENGMSHSVESLQITLPVVQGVQEGWQNKLSLTSFQLNGNDVVAEIEFNEASLCGILIAASEPECQVGTAFTGPLKVQGTVSPFKVSASFDWGLAAGPVLNDPYIREGSEPILHMKDGKMIGKLVATEDRLDFQSLRFKWPDVPPVNVAGSIRYVPTLVDLNASLEEGELSDMFKDIVDFNFGGKSTIEAKIVYDHSLQKERRTKVEGNLRSKEFFFEDQSLGTLSGPISYINQKLNLGPFQLRKGGGSGVLRGSLLRSESRGPFLTLIAQLRRFEYVAALGDEGTEAFRGFITGRGVLDGFVDRDRHPDNGLKGDLQFRAQNFRAFEIPFDSAELEAKYVNEDLSINQLLAFKDNAKLSMKGKLSPTGGSLLEFKSDPIPLRSIDIEPKLKIFERGEVSIDGFWSPVKGWGIKGDIKNAVVAGKSLGAGSANLGGDDKGLNIALQLGKALDMQYQGVYSANGTDIQDLRVFLQNDGIYAGFAYLGDWQEEKRVRGQGQMDIRWSPGAGHFKTKDLQIFAPHRQANRSELLLSVPGSQGLVWEDNKVISNSLNWSEASSGQVSFEMDDGRVGIEGSLPLGLLRLVLPEVDVRYGTIDFRGSVPLPPHFSTVEIDGKVRNGILKIPEVSSVIDSLNVDLRMRRSQVSLIDGSMNAGGGKAKISGVYKVDFDLPAADIDLQLDGAELVVLDDVLGRYTGNLQVRGEKMPYMMSGSLAGSNILYTKEFDDEDPVVPVVGEPALKFDVDLNIGSDSYIRNTVVNSSMYGALSIAGDSNSPLINGTLSLSDGHITTNQTRFRIVQSRVQFYGSEENVPLVDLRAVTTMSYGGSDYKIEMNVRGPGASLAIDFTSDPALPQRDIVSLLAFGVIRQDERVAGEGDADDLVSAAQAEAFQAIFGEAIGNNLSKRTGFDVRLRASESEAGQNDNVPKVSVARRLSDRITARFARSLDVNNPEKDLQVDYQLLNNVNLSGVWESPTPEESSVGVDLRFRFDVE